MKHALIPFLLLVSFHSHSGGFDFAASDDYVRLNYQISRSNNFSGASVDVGAVFNEHRDLLGYIQVMTNGDVVGETDRFHFGVGVKIAGFELENYSFAPDFDNALYAALSLRFGYIPGNEIPMLLYLDIHSTPSVLAFSSLQRALDIELGYKIDFLPSAFFTIGYNLIKLTPEAGGDVDLIDGYFISFGGSF